MINARELLDAMVNANATRHAPDAPDNAQRSFLQDALEAGFGDVSHFNRRFKRRYLMTPSDMRRHTSDIRKPTRMTHNGLG